MPIYIYENPQTGKIKEVVQGINEDHVYSEGKIKWQRIWTSPNASVDTLSNIDCDSERQFLNKTKNMKGTVGDIMDLSTELGQKRQKLKGKDNISAKYYKDWQKRRGGKMHPDDPKKKDIINKKLKNNPFVEVE